MGSSRPLLLAAYRGTGYALVMGRPFFAYMLQCADGSYYVGHTDDLEKRVAEHDDVWARSIITLFSTPLSVGEFLAAITLLGAVKLMMTLGFMTLLALLVYSFNLFSLGLALLPFVANLIVLGWSVGLFSVGLILRYGTRVAVLAWSLPFMLQPVSSVFWPESVLPSWLRGVAQLVPSNHVFEGMRGVLLKGELAWDRLAFAALTNGLYRAVAGTYFVWVFRIARRKGLLTKIR